MDEISDQGQIEDEALRAIAQMDVTVADPVTGDVFKVVAGDPIPIGYAVIAIDKPDDESDDDPKS